MNGRSRKPKLKTKTFDLIIESGFNGEEEVSARFVSNAFVNDFVLLFAGTLEVRLFNKLNDLFVRLDHRWQIEQGTDARVAVHSCQRG